MKQRLLEIKNWLLKKKIAKHLCLFFVLQLGMVYVFTCLEIPNVIEPCTQEELQLPSVVEEEFPLCFTLSILLIGITFEEIIFRFLPHWLLKKNLKKYTIPCFYIISTVIHTLAHQGNVLSGTLSGRIRYLAIHTTSGGYFAWLFINKGFLATWLIHNLFDFIIVGMTLLLNV